MTILVSGPKGSEFLADATMRRRGIRALRWCARDAGGARDRAHLGPGIFFTEACSFLGLFRHNFTENDPQDLKMV
jgi:hypothetical protein